MPDTKTCNRCQETKPVSEFWKLTKSDDGLQRSCKECRRKMARDAYKADPERHRKKTRAFEIRRDYGLSVDEYREALSEGCAICGATADLCLDHDHESGRPRAALCDRCNRGIGLLRDDPSLLDKAAAYIRGWRDAHREVAALN